jgi:hypothetical protein
MSFAFHIEVVIGAGKPDDAATVGAKPNQAVTAQRVNVDPKCALDRWPPAMSSAAKSAHLADSVTWAQLAGANERSLSREPYLTLAKRFSRVLGTRHKVSVFKVRERRRGSHLA